MPKRGAGAKVTPGPRLSAAAVHAHTAASSGKKGVCCNCGIERSQNTPFPPKIDNACVACFAPFPSAFSQHGTFAEFVEKKSKSAELQASYDQARRVLLKKETVNWPPCEVADEDGFRVNHIVSMVGPSRADLCKLLEGTTPEDLGIKLENLEHPDGSTYKGLLIPDPQCPWPRFEFISSRSVKKSHTRMDKSAQIYQTQPEDSMRYIKNQKLESSKFGSLLMTKMRTAPGPSTPS